MLQGLMHPVNVCCTVCKKPISDKDFLKEPFSGDPLYWLQTKENVFAFCGPQHASQWHKEQAVKKE